MTEPTVSERRIRLLLKNATASTRGPEAISWFSSSHYKRNELLSVRYLQVKSSSQTTVTDGLAPCTARVSCTAQTTGTVN